MKKNQKLDSNHNFIVYYPPQVSVIDGFIMFVNQIQGAGRLKVYFGLVIFFSRTSLLQRK